METPPRKNKSGKDARVRHELLYRNKVNLLQVLEIVRYERQPHSLNTNISSGTPPLFSLTLLVLLSVRWFISACFLSVSLVFARKPSFVHSFGPGHFAIPPGHTLPGSLCLKDFPTYLTNSRFAIWRRLSCSPTRFCIPDMFRFCSQAEELNSIVGNAFRMAYAAQLQRQPTFQEVIASQLQDTPGWQSSVEMNVKLQDTPSLRLLGGKDPPKSIPGLRPVHSMDPPSNQSTPSSEESNSPTDLNSYKRLADKPPLIKRLALGLTNNERTEDSRPLVTPTATSPVRRPLSGGYVNEAVTDTEFNKSNEETQTKQIEIDSSRLVDRLRGHCASLRTCPFNSRLFFCRLSQSSEQELKTKRISQISSSSSGSCPTGTTRPPPPPPERTDSLTGRAEEGELRAAPWFQAGIPRYAPSSLTLHSMPVTPYIKPVTHSRTWLLYLPGKSRWKF